MTSGESDINDAFDDILLTEESLTKEGYNEGYQEGLAEGNIEGYKLGYAKGYELGAELGEYYGTVVYYLKIVHSTQNKRILENLKQSIEDFPRTNDPSVDILSEIADIRTQYKRVKAVLKLRGEAPSTEKNILLHLTPSLPFVNCHMVEFLTGNLWEKFIPAEIKNEIENDSDIENATKLLLGYEEDTKGYPNIYKFIKESEKHRLENLEGTLLSQTDLFEAIGAQIKTSNNSVNIKEFMNEKKNHEVEIISKLVSSLVNSLQNFEKEDVYVLDAGDGKGYLSSRLALQYNMKVLGIDASDVNTEGSQKRMKKLERAWQGLKERTEIINMGLTPPRRSKKPRKKSGVENNAPTATSTYKAINNYITKDTDFDELIRNNFCIENDFSMCLTGLHTCGNLAPTCLEAFANNPRIKLLCNVGCCYHLLSEMYFEDEFTNSESISSKSNCHGFPLSNYLKTKHMKLGRNARMLASQSIHRTQMKNNMNTQPLFYRALLEIIIQERYPQLTETPRVGKVKNFSNFNEYLKRCEAKCSLEFGSLEGEYVDEVLKKYAKMESLISLFYLIRMSYAQIIETLILLDRLLYLQENGVEKSYLIRLFDPVTSPRCYGVVAVR